MCHGLLVLLGNVTTIHADPILNLKYIEVKNEMFSLFTQVGKNSILYFNKTIHMHRKNEKVCLRC
jgi:hypothetical protein